MSESATTVFLSVFRRVPRIEQRSQHVEWKRSPRGRPLREHPLFSSAALLKHSCEHTLAHAFKHASLPHTEQRRSRTLVRTVQQIVPYTISVSLNISGTYSPLRLFIDSSYFQLKSLPPLPPSPVDCFHGDNYTERHENTGFFMLCVIEELKMNHAWFWTYFGMTVGQLELLAPDLRRLTKAN